MRRITLFYSWQSDRDSALCRRFIETALNEAVELLKADDVDLTIDSDTANVAGTPPVSDTILAKIRACDIFLADVTLVSSTDERKHAPNPNVLVEYGYALARHGVQRLLLVMNTAFGSPSELPFDLRHLRHPEQYDAPDGISDAPRRQRRSALAAKLASHIALIAREVGQARRAEDVDASGKAADLVTDRLLARQRADIPVIVSSPSLTLYFVPLAALQRPALRPADVLSVLESFQPPGAQRSFQGANEHMWWTHGPAERVGDRLNREAPWSLVFVRPGVLEFTVNLSRRIEDDTNIVVEGRKVEAWIVRMAERMSELADELGLAGRAYLAVALDGLEDVDVIAGRLAALRIRRPSILLSGPTIQVGAEPVSAQLRDLLDQLWLAIGRPAGSPSYASGRWDGDAGAYDFELP